MHLYIYDLVSTGFVSTIASAALAIEGQKYLSMSISPTLAATTTFVNILALPFIKKRINRKLNMQIAEESDSAEESDFEESDNEIKNSRYEILLDMTTNLLGHFPHYFFSRKCALEAMAITHLFESISDSFILFNLNAQSLIEFNKEADKNNVNNFVEDTKNKILEMHFKKFNTRIGLQRRSL